MEGDTIADAVIVFPGDDTSQESRVIVPPLPPDDEFGDLGLPLVFNGNRDQLLGAHAINPVIKFVNHLLHRKA